MLRNLESVTASEASSSVVNNGLEANYLQSAPAPFNRARWASISNATHMCERHVSLTTRILSLLWMLCFDARTVQLFNSGGSVKRALQVRVGEFFFASDVDFPCVFCCIVSLLIAPLSCSFEMGMECLAGGAC